MFKIGKTESNICPICLLEIEDIIHMFIGCLELQDFKNNFVIYHLETLMKDIDIGIYNTLEFHKMFSLHCQKA